MTTGVRMPAEGHWRSLDKITTRERLKREDDRKKKRENDENPKKGSHDWHMSKPCRKNLIGWMVVRVGKTTHNWGFFWMKFALI